MSNPFFDQPILNSPYEYPRRHWELDETGQPTQRVIEARCGAKFTTPIPKMVNSLEVEVVVRSPRSRQQRTKACMGS